MTDPTPRGQLKRQDKAMTREDAEALLTTACANAPAPPAPTLALHHA